MRVAIDYTLAHGHIGGMGLLVQNISRTLKKLGKNEYILISNPHTFNKKDFLSKITSVAKQHLWYQTQIMSDLRSKKVDVLYMPNPPIPFFYAKPIVLTIPDMAFYHENINIFIKTYLYLTYFLSAKKASKIITISNYSEADIVKILKVNPNKIEVIPLAIEKEFYKNKISSNSINSTLVKYKIKKPFILCDPGSFVPRKNVGGLIEAVCNLPKKLQPFIVLVGNNTGLDYMKLDKLVEKLNMKSKVIFTGYVSPLEKVAIYKAAKIHVYPSLYEGFGLPPLQAMAMGVPSIVYNKTSLPEVVGSAGIKVDNPQELTKAIAKLINNKRVYDSFVAKGIERSKKFSWEITAKKFEKIVNNQSSLVKHRLVI